MAARAKPPRPLPHDKVNNAGIVEFGSIAETDLQVFRRVIDINLCGPWLGGVPLRRRRGEQAVASLNGSSAADGLMGYANLGAYVASKWALRGLAKTAALELAADGIRVCSMHPGPSAPL